jgi:cobalt-zinc-cadmium efflux system outer membrane protein
MKNRILLIGIALSLCAGHELARAITPSDPAGQSSGEDSSVPFPNEQHIPPNLSGDVTLQEVLAGTLRGSPRLAAYSWEVRSSEAQIIQARLLPNPELSISPENFGGSGVFGDNVQYQNTLQLSQLVELGDKRQLRTEAAAVTRDRTLAEYESKRVEVLGDATVDFIDVVRWQEEVRLARVALEQAEGLTKAVERRIKASVGSPLEAKRARILAARAENALLRAERTLRGAKQKLAANWGNTDAEIGRAAGDVFATHPLPPLKTLIERVEKSPDHRVAVAEEKVRAAEAALVRSRRVSDFVVSGAWRHGRDFNDQAVVAGLSFPLKLFDRAQGDIASSEAQVKKSKVETSSVEVRLRAAVFGLYQEIVQARDEAESMAKDIVPWTEEAVALARTGFGQGIYSQLDLLDAQRTLIEVRREQIEAGARYHRLVAEVEKLLGAPFWEFWRKR